MILAQQHSTRLREYNLSILSTQQSAQGVALMRVGLEDFDLVVTFHSTILYSSLVLLNASNMWFTSTQLFLFFTSLN